MEYVLVRIAFAAFAAGNLWVYLAHGRRPLNAALALYLALAALMRL